MTRVTKLKGSSRGHPYATPPPSSGFISRSLLRPKAPEDSTPSPTKSASSSIQKKKNKKKAASREPVCYYCGTTEHTGLDQCQEYRARVKELKSLQRQQSATPKNIYLPFAECFICKQKGHLQGLCPENPKGLYPNGGGCRFCASVRHFAVDCPLAGSESASKKFLTAKEQDVGISTIGLMDLSQGADDDDVCYALFRASKVGPKKPEPPKKKAHKFVRF